MGNIYIGIDNGVSGSIGVVNDFDIELFPTPTKKHLKYTKKKAYVTRIDVPKLTKLLDKYCLANCTNVKVMVERPMVNPTRFVATSSALRAWEATLIVLEQLEIPYELVDSKAWQKAMLPSGVKGAADLKQASIQVGKRKAPHLKAIIDKQRDADGLLIALYAKQIG
jgi:hypothetical protein